jgi:hypothetical protein
MISGDWEYPVEDEQLTVTVYHGGNTELAIRSMP